MIITGGDANKYSRNPKAYMILCGIMDEIRATVRAGEMRTSYYFNTVCDETIDQVKEWVREKNYDVCLDCDVLKIDWSNK